MTCCSGGTCPFILAHLDTEITHRKRDLLAADILAVRPDTGNTQLNNHGSVSIFNRGRRTISQTSPGRVPVT
jgi:hypothetical protein